MTLVQHCEIHSGCAGRKDRPDTQGGSERLEERGDQSPMAQNLKAWQTELKLRLGNALKELEPDSAGYAS